MSDIHQRPSLSREDDSVIHNSDLLAVRTDGSLQSSPDSSDYHASDESEHSPHPSPPLRSQRSMDNSFSASVEQQKSRRARAPSEPSTDSDSDQTADTPPKRVKLNHTTIVASDSDNGPSRNMPAPFPYLVSDSDRQHSNHIVTIQVSDVDDRQTAKHELSEAEHPRPTQPQTASKKRKTNKKIMKEDGDRLPFQDIKNTV